MNDTRLAPGTMVSFMRRSRDHKGREVRWLDTGRILRSDGVTSYVILHEAGGTFIRRHEEVQPK